MTEQTEPADVQAQLDAEGQLDESVDSLSTQVPEDYPQIDNTCWVSIDLKVSNFSGSPEEAVEHAMMDYIMFGMRDRLFTVRDVATGMQYAVLDGRTLTPEEIEELRDES